jgi:hypothetical protein
MSADLLRRAAAELRTRAEAATPGPWAVDRDRIGMWFTLNSRANFEYSHQAQIVDVHTPDESWPDFNYMAMMHPPVALALAETLDQAAEAWAIDGAEPVRNPRDRSMVFLAAALAREILRESQP